MSSFTSQAIARLYLAGEVFSFSQSLSQAVCGRGTAPAQCNSQLSHSLAERWKQDLIARIALDDGGTKMTEREMDRFETALARLLADMPTFVLGPDDIDPHQVFRQYRTDPDGAAMLLVRGLA